MSPEEVCALWDIQEKIEPCIHFEQIKDISPLLFHLLTICYWLWEALLKYRQWDETAFPSLSPTTIIISSVTKAVPTNWDIPSPKHFTFFGEFLSFLFHWYGYWRGTATKTRNNEGSILFQCTLNSPLITEKHDCDFIWLFKSSHATVLGVMVDNQTTLQTTDCCELLPSFLN